MSKISSLLKILRPDGTIPPGTPQTDMVAIAGLVGEAATDWHSNPAPVVGLSAAALKKLLFGTPRFNHGIRALWVEAGIWTDGRFWLRLPSPRGGHGLTEEEAQNAAQTVTHLAACCEAYQPEGRPLRLIGGRSLESGAEVVFEDALGTRRDFPAEQIATVSRHHPGSVWYYSSDREAAVAAVATDTVDGVRERVGVVMACLVDPHARGERKFVVGMPEAFPRLPGLLDLFAPGPYLPGDEDFGRRSGPFPEILQGDGTYKPRGEGAVPDPECTARREFYARLAVAPVPTYYFDVEKGEEGFEVIHRETGLNAGGWKRKRDAHAWAALLELLPVSWATVTHDKPISAEEGVIIRAARRAFEENEIPEGV